MDFFAFVADPAIRFGEPPAAVESFQPVGSDTFRQPRCSPPCNPGVFINIIENLTEKHKRFLKKDKTICKNSNNRPRPVL